MAVLRSEMDCPLPGAGRLVQELVGVLFGLVGRMESMRIQQISLRALELLLPMLNPADVQSYLGENPIARLLEFAGTLTYLRPLSPPGKVGTPPQMGVVCDNDDLIPMMRLVVYRVFPDEKDEILVSKNLSYRKFIDRFRASIRAHNKQISTATRAGSFSALAQAHEAAGGGADEVSMEQWGAEMRRALVEDGKATVFVVDHSTCESMSMKMSAAGIQCGVESSPPTRCATRNRAIIESRAYFDGYFTFGGEHCSQIASELVRLVRVLAAGSTVANERTTCGDSGSIQAEDSESKQGCCDWAEFTRKAVISSVSSVEDCDLHSIGPTFSTPPAELLSSIGAICVAGGTGVRHPRVGGLCESQDGSMKGVLYGANVGFPEVLMVSESDPDRIPMSVRRNRLTFPDRDADQRSEGTGSWSHSERAQLVGALVRATGIVCIRRQGLAGVFGLLEEFVTSRVFSGITELLQDGNMIDVDSLCGEEFAKMLKSNALSDESSFDIPELHRTWARSFARIRDFHYGSLRARVDALYDPHDGITSAVGSDCNVSPSDAADVPYALSAHLRNSVVLPSAMDHSDARHCVFHGREMLSVSYFGGHRKKPQSYNLPVTVLANARIPDSNIPFYFEVTVQRRGKTPPIESLSVGLCPASAPNSGQQPLGWAAGSFCYRCDGRRGEFKARPKTPKTEKLEIGDVVDAKDKVGKWERAIVVEESRDKVKIHYCEWHPKYDEWIHRACDRLSPYRQRSTGAGGALHMSDYGQPFGDCDVIGCWYDRQAKTVEFTCNGDALGVAFTDVPAVDYFPAVCLQEATRVSVNLGQVPFIYRRAFNYITSRGTNAVASEEESVAGAISSTIGRGFSELSSRVMDLWSPSRSSREAQIERVRQIAVSFQEDADPNECLVQLQSALDSFQACSGNNPDETQDIYTYDAAEPRERKLRETTDLSQSSSSFSFPDHTLVETPVRADNVDAWLSQLEHGLSDTSVDRATIIELVDQLRRIDFSSLILQAVQPPNASADAATGPEINPSPIMVIRPSVSPRNQSHLIRVGARVKVGHFARAAACDSSARSGGQHVSQWLPAMDSTADRVGTVRRLDKESSVALVEFMDMPTSRVKAWWYPLESLVSVPHYCRNSHIGMESSRDAYANTVKAASQLKRFEARQCLSAYTRALVSRIPLPVTPTADVSPPEPSALSKLMAFSRISDSVMSAFRGGHQSDSTVNDLDSKQENIDEMLLPLVEQCGLSRGDLAELFLRMQVYSRSDGLCFDVWGDDHEMMRKWTLLFHEPDAMLDLANLMLTSADNILADNSIQISFCTFNPYGNQTLSGISPPPGLDADACADSTSSHHRRRPIQRLWEKRVGVREACQLIVTSEANFELPSDVTLAFYGDSHQTTVLRAFSGPRTSLPQFTIPQNKVWISCFSVTNRLQVIKNKPKKARLSLKMSVCPISPKLIVGCSIMRAFSTTWQHPSDWPVESARRAQSACCQLALSAHAPPPLAVALLRTLVRFVRCAPIDQSTCADVTSLFRVLKDVHNSEAEIVKDESKGIHSQLAQSLFELATAIFASESVDLVCSESADSTSNLYDLLMLTPNPATSLALLRPEACGGHQPDHSNTAVQVAERLFGLAYNLRAILTGGDRFVMRSVLGDRYTDSISVSKWSLSQMERLCRHLTILAQRKRKQPTSLRQREVEQSTELIEDFAEYGMCEIWPQVAFLQSINITIEDHLQYIDLSSEWLGALLARCRRLIFPLRAKLNFVRRVMANTATGSAESAPRIIVNRILASDAEIDIVSRTTRQDAMDLCSVTVFGQAYQQLRDVNPSLFRVPAPKGSGPHVGFSASFVGEQVLGQAGPYRAFFSDICREVQSTSDPDKPSSLPLLVPTPNHQHSLGESRELFMPNPRCRSIQHRQLFEFLGRLIGIAMRTRVILSLDLPSIVWKMICGETSSRADLAQVDISLCQNVLSALEKFDDRSCFRDVFGDLRFGKELIPHVESENIRADDPVTFDNRLIYCKALERFHLIDYLGPQIKAICDGFWSIVPRSLLRIITWAELKLQLCGDQGVDIELLKRHTEYSGVDKNAPHIAWFWSALESFSGWQRRRFVEFAYASARLPSTDAEFEHAPRTRMLIKAAAAAPDGQSADDMLPRADTCFFNVELPAYSSEEVMHARLRAVVAMDWGMSGDAHLEPADGIGGHGLAMLSALPIMEGQSGGANGATNGDASRGRANSAPSGNSTESGISESFAETFRRILGGQGSELFPLLSSDSILNDLANGASTREVLESLQSHVNSPHEPDANGGNNNDGGGGSNNGANNNNSSAAPAHPRAPGANIERTRARLHSIRTRLNALRRLNNIGDLVDSVVAESESDSRISSRPRSSTSSTDASSQSISRTPLLSASLPRTEDSDTVSIPSLVEESGDESENLEPDSDAPPNLISDSEESLSDEESDSADFDMDLNRVD
eukprot:438335_1